MTNVIVLAFFIPLLARLCRAIIRTAENDRVKVLETHLLATPSLALQAVQAALADMTRRAWTVASVSLQSCLGKADVNAESIENAEREIDDLREQVRNYLIELSQRKLTAREAEMIPELLHCANDAERISDLALKVYLKTDRVKDGAAEGSVASQVTSVAAKVRRFAHAKEALAVLSVLNCLRDIARHLGNIAVRAPQFA